MKRSPQLESTISELEKHGAKILSVSDTAGSHAKVAFLYQGKTEFIIAGQNAASHNAPYNARRTVRHKLGIQRFRVTGKRRRHKNHANRPAPTCPEHFSLGRDPWRSITGTTLAQQTAAYAADQAWARFFGAHLIKAGHRPVNLVIREAVGA